MSNTNHLPTRELVRQTALRLKVDVEERMRRFEETCRRLTGKPPEWDSCGANPVGFNGTQQQEIADAK